MTDHKPLTTQQLTDIEARTQAATEGPWCTDAWEIYQGTEYQPGLSMWIGETCRGTSTPEQDQADAAFVAAARTDVPALLALVRRLQARVTELERPAVEAKRNEIRDSFAELAATAREDRDFEGAFNVECDLRKREEQWAAEDAAAPAAGESGSTR